MLLEKSGKWILVDHKTAIGDLAYCEKKSAEYLVQMEAYRRMIEDSTGQPVSTVCLHYPISGVIVEIEL